MNIFSQNNKKFWLITLCIAVFAVITLVYFKPILEGQRVKQHDVEMFKGMSKEIVDYRESSGEQALWTNSMFGGMPSWNISVEQDSNLITYIHKVLTLGFPHPLGSVFIAMVGFFVLLLVMGCSIWASLVGGLAYGFTSYLFIVIGAGHNSKAITMAYMAPVIAGILLTYKGKYLWGALLTALFVALQVRAGHVQITYYLFLIVICLVVAEFIHALREKQIVSFAKASGILVVAGVVGVMTCVVPLYANYEYGKETMRGKPVLQAENTAEQHDLTDGLDRSYITQWSYGRGETWSLMIPNVKGGATQQIGRSNPALDVAESRFRGDLSQQNAYWGDQPYTSGPVYVGAIVCLLFILGLFVVDDRYKWPLLIATLLSIFLSWGKNFQWFTDIFIDYFPAYSKFRAVSMTLVIAEVTIPFLALLALGKILQDPSCLKDKMWKVYTAFGLTGGLCLLFTLTPSTFFSFLSDVENAQFSEFYNGRDGSIYKNFATQLTNVRMEIFKADAIRSFLFITAAVVVLFLYLKGKIKESLACIFLAVLIIGDMFTVDKRYLNDDNFIAREKAEKPFVASVADEAILADASLDYRVLDMTKNVFNDASTSYFHKSVGGYHGAKLRRYQDVIDRYLMGEIHSLPTVMKNAKTMREIYEGLGTLKVLNMLNTKYIIYDGNAKPLGNPQAYGNAWTVDNIRWVESANKEIDAIAATDTRREAILHEEFKQYVGEIRHDSAARIELMSYTPNELRYSFESRGSEVVVFSEVWTQRGWKLYIDEEASNLLRADYFLRAAFIPQGSHEIILRYEPSIWHIGNTIAFITSLLIILGLLFCVYRSVKKP